MTALYMNPIDRNQATEIKLIINDIKFYDNGVYFNGSLVILKVFDFDIHFWSFTKILEIEVMIGNQCLLNKLQK